MLLLSHILNADIMISQLENAFIKVSYILMFAPNLIKKITQNDQTLKQEVCIAI